MSYLIYKGIHIFGIGLLIASVGGMSVHALISGDKAQSLRRTLLQFHGVGLFLVLLGGFGMLARLGMGMPWPGWLYLKIAVWFMYGGLIALLYKSDCLNKAVWFATPTLLFLAWYLATYKP